ncbi:MAG: hypothetical protein ACWGSQ_10755, partial [Longimicrobiales bacterium]
SRTGFRPSPQPPPLLLTVGGEVLPEAEPLGALRGAAWTLGAVRGADLDTAPEPGALAGALTVGSLAGARPAEPMLGARAVGALSAPELCARVVGAPMPPLFGVRPEGAEAAPRPGAREEGAAVPPLDGTRADGVEAVPRERVGVDPADGTLLPPEAGALAEGLLCAAVPALVDGEPVVGRPWALAEGLVEGVRAEAVGEPVAERPEGALTVGEPPLPAAPGPEIRSEGLLPCEGWATAPLAVPGRTAPGAAPV